MLVKIKEFIMTENGIEILKLIVTVGIAYITARITARNTRKNLTTQYFKEKGIEIQEKVLRFWCGLVINNFKIMDAYIEAFNNRKLSNVTDADILINVQKESYIYSSSKTINAIKDYQQYLYKSKNLYIEKSEAKVKQNSTKSKIEFINQLILIVRIISRMKYDFTGEKVDELDLIKIKIKDLNFIMRLLCRIILWYYNVREFLVKLILTFIILVVILIIYDNIFDVFI